MFSNFSLTASNSCPLALNVLPLAKKYQNPVQSGKLVCLCWGLCRLQYLTWDSVLLHSGRYSLQFRKINFQITTNYQNLSIPFTIIFCRPPSTCSLQIAFTEVSDTHLETLHQVITHFHTTSDFGTIHRKISQVYTHLESPIYLPAATNSLAYSFYVASTNNSAISKNTLVREECNTQSCNTQLSLIVLSFQAKGKAAQVMIIRILTHSKRN